MPTSKQSPNRIEINRAPVLTLWAAIVAERLGHSPDEALTLGKALAGLNAYSKGLRLGIYEPSTEPPKARKSPRPGERLAVPLLGREIPAIETDQGIRALAKDQPIQPAAVERYLNTSFGDALASTRAAMTDLARHLSPEDLAQQGYALYEQFRPTVPKGKRGWGAKGELDLTLIRSLAR